MNPKYTEQQIVIALEQFEAYPDLQVIYISSDNQVFHQSNHNDAVNHQRRLDEAQKLVIISRKSLAAAEEEEEEEDDDDDFDFKKELLLEQELRAKREQEKAEEEERLKLEEEDRLKAEEDERLKLEEEARLKAEEGVAPETVAEAATPDETWKNSDIVAWLKEKGVEEKPNQKKELLLEKVAEALKLNAPAPTAQ